mmetsp:Transcript_122419/g.346080  ORF Transcript_122419/g.346080 Transcript_122419/m.346080 type:complete len:882 (-) Transcript_122419:135-2780(-)
MGSEYPCWEFLDCTGEVPQSRSGHTCALHKNRYLYIFGGFDGSNCFDDLYVLDLDGRSWRKIEAGGDRPSGRASHSAVTDDIAGVMYIFGGSGSHFGYTNKRDLCELCFETECWRLLSNPLEDTPSARYGQSMVAYKEGLYVWGGTHGTNYPTDMHRFDLCSKQWEHVATTGELPCGRYRHQAMVKDDLMYIVGGSGINRYGDVFTFHFGSSVWRKLVCTGTDLSDGRYAHSAVLRDGYIYLYGGNDGVRHDDLQKLDLETRVWSRVGVHGHCPPGRDFHAAVLRKDSMVIFGGSNGMRRHNDVFEFHMSPKNPPCTLSLDLEAMLDQAQTDEAMQLSCDVFLAADDGDSAHGVYCHSHMLYVRCPRLYRFVQDIQIQPETTAGNTSGMGHLADASMHQALVDPMAVKFTERPATYPGADGTGGLGPTQFPRGKEGRDNRDETIDSLLRAVVTDDGEEGGQDREGRRRARQPPVGWGYGWPSGHCAWVPIDVSHPILTHFMRYIYCDNARFGRLNAEQLYQLLLVAKEFDVQRLAALCERQIKVRLGLDTVLPLLRASARDGAPTAVVQDACKHFFLANYHLCTELRECEALDPRLLCELMRLHNSRVSSASCASTQAAQQQAQQQQQQQQQRIGTSGGNGSPSLLTPMTPQPLGRAVGSDDIGVRVSQALDPSVVPIPIPTETLAEDLKRLLMEEVGTDFEVVAQDEVIRTHRFVLAARSKYFASCILTSGMVESQVGRLVIPPSSAMTAEAFRAFLRFLYAGDDILGLLAPHMAMYLVDASSFYGLTNGRLKHFCELCVRDSFNETHVLQLFEASSRLSVEAVRTMALEFIITHFHTVCRQPALEQLDKPLLIDILKGLAECLPQQSAAVSAGTPQSLG